jgi:RHS repeat-associated protein
MVDGRCESIVADHLGAPVAMLDESGSLSWSGELSPWGELRPGPGQPVENLPVENRWAVPFRWPGQYEDAETGLYYNRFRYYDPEAGQYTSQDPIGLAGGSALYGYVRDPAGWIDPLGLACTPTSRGGWRDARGRFARPDARDIAQEAKRRQGLNPSTPLPTNFKEKFSHGRFDYEVRAHPAQPGAPPGSNSANGPTFRVARRRQGTNSAGQGYGWEYADDAGKWFHTKFLKTASSDPLAATAADATHIPLI